MTPVPAGECAGPAAARDTVVVGVAREREPLVLSGCGVALVVRAAAGDQRDQVDAGLDVVLTRDPATLAYARSRAGFSLQALPWDRTYALVVPGRPASWMTDTSAAFRARLARDAVSGDARGAEGPFWWEASAPECGPAAAAPFLDSVVAYHRDDPTARELAERLVALAAARGIRLRAIGRTPPSSPVPIRDAAAVLPLPRDSAGAGACGRGLFDATIVPLVDTRPTAIVRRGRARIDAGAGRIVILAGDSLAPAR